MVWDSTSNPYNSLYTNPLLFFFLKKTIKKEKRKRKKENGAPLLSLCGYASGPQLTGVMSTRWIGHSGRIELVALQMGERFNSIIKRIAML